MSVSLYRGQVDRLMKEISDLERKAADERARDQGARRRAPEEQLDWQVNERQHAAIQGARHPAA
jgi:hypothetical protein